MMTASQQRTVRGRIDVTDPESGDLVGSVPQASGGDIESALAKAAEVQRAQATLRSYASLARGPDTIPIPTMTAEPGTERYVARIDALPVGVVVAITPFNDPLNLTAHKLGAAVAAGCPIIVKPHEQTPLVVDRLIRETDWSCLGDGFVQVVHGAGSTVGSRLVADQRVSAVSFTGGVETGRKIAATAGIKHLLFELGGNCPTLIWRDADLDHAVPALVSGMIAAAGQNCLHVQRIYVHPDRREELQARLVDRVAQVRLGAKLDPATQMGPLLTPGAADRIHELTTSARAGGAAVLVGGERYRRAGYTPTLIADVPTSHALNTTEIFGPVTTLTSPDSLDEALYQMNDTSTPLQAGVFAQDPATITASRRQLRFEAAVINNSSDFRIDTMPFGGPRLAGLGREGGRWGIGHLTEPRLTLTYAP